MHVVGEVENDTPKVAPFVEIIGTFYDSNNKVVGTSSTFTSPTDLASGEIAPFDLMLSDASILIEQIERYNKYNIFFLNYNNITLLLYQRENGLKIKSKREEEYITDI